MGKPATATFGMPSVRIWRERSEWGVWAVHVEVYDLANGRKHRQSWAVDQMRMNYQRDAKVYLALRIRADIADKEEVIAYPAWLIHAATGGAISQDRAKRLLMIRIDKAIRHHIEEISK